MLSSYSITESDLEFKSGPAAFQNCSNWCTAPALEEDKDLETLYCDIDVFYHDLKSALFFVPQFYSDSSMPFCYNNIQNDNQRLIIIVYFCLDYVWKSIVMIPVQYVCFVIKVFKAKCILRFVISAVVLLTYFQNMEIKN